MLSDTDTSEQVKFPSLSASENTIGIIDYNVRSPVDGDCGEYDATPQIDTATGNRYVTVGVARSPRMVSGSYSRRSSWTPWDSGVDFEMRWILRLLVRRIPTP